MIAGRLCAPRFDVGGFVLMKLLTFREGDALKLGLRVDNGVIDVAAAAEALGLSGVPTSVDEVFAGGETALGALSDLANRGAIAPAGEAWLRDEMGLRYGPCVPHPGKIICIGLNYRKHAMETNSPIPESPVVFSKFSNTITANGDSVPLPAVAHQYDYEVELGFAIGKRAAHVSEADALNYVLGYFTANDVSVRDLQTRTSQWLLGKTLDKFLPIGPWLVTADEVPDPQKLRLQTWVNGDLRQDSNTEDMIFNVAQIISYISTYFALEPGDIVVTGTPAGVAMGLPDKPWLKPNDEVSVEVEGLGKLTNVMIA
jgi:2-keto-4-pentenoate hydratase/2-oxohepta-3-ene-1,7-dioic acid hydratase in catechol pathway